MSTPVRRMTHYSGLAQGQGPVTFSTSPLWSPYGPYAMNRKQFQGQFGALDFHGYHGEHSDATGGMMGTLKESAQKILDHKTLGVPSWILATGAFLAYRAGLLNRILPIPLRANRWDAMTSVPGVASQMAKMRWAIAAGDEDGIKEGQKYFAKLAKMPLTKWKGRHFDKSYGPYRSSKKSAKKPAGFIETIVDVITPELAPTEKARKPSRKKVVRKPSRKKTSKKSSKGINAYVMKQAAKLQKQGLSRSEAVSDAWETANRLYKRGDYALNPRRRKNGTKKGMARKTARRAYMKNGTKKGMRRKTARRAYMRNRR